MVSSARTLFIHRGTAWAFSPLICPCCCSLSSPVYKNNRDARNNAVILSRSSSYPVETALSNLLSLEQHRYLVGVLQLTGQIDALKAAFTGNAVIRSTLSSSYPARMNAFNLLSTVCHRGLLKAFWPCRKANRSVCDFLARLHSFPASRYGQEQKAAGQCTIAARQDHTANLISRTPYNREKPTHPLSKAHNARKP